MNILVINGSPRMERSNSLRMTHAFLEGLSKTCDTQVEELTVAKMHIEPCLGCLNCWKRTPGKCFRDDDMAAAIERYVTADLVVWSFPLYYYALPGQLKCFLDRTVPINRPVMCDRTDGKGKVTAGNSCGRSDAGAALLLMSGEKVKELGVKPMARIVAHAIVGVDPRIMGMGPVPAVRKVLEKAGLTLDDIGMIELNEAFAAQSLAVIRELGLDMAKVNVSGGAIAMGHPLGATGGRILTTLVHGMKRTRTRYGIATLCMGGGQGGATLLELAD